MKTNRIISRYLFVLPLALLLITGCLFSTPTNSGIIGLWVEHPTDKKISRPCGSFEFLYDGTFIATNIPSKYFMDFLPERFSSSGIWELDTSSENVPLGVHQIKLRFAPEERFPFGFDSVIYIAIDGGMLFGGVDDNVLFKKGEKCE